MSTPRSVKLNEDILLVFLQDDVLESIGDNIEYGLVLALGNRLALNAGWNFALAEFGNEITDVLGVNFLALGHGELGRLLDLLDGE